MLGVILTTYRIVLTSTPSIICYRRIGDTLRYITSIGVSQTELLVRHSSDYNNPNRITAKHCYILDPIFYNRIEGLYEI